jgi:hypothetical protein
MVAGERPGLQQRVTPDPEELDRRCRMTVLDPPSRSEQGAVELYVSHYQELALPPEGATRGVRAFARAMTVSSIWITADEDEELLHVDYAIDAKRTQYVLSVTLDHDGVARSVRMES